MSEKLTARNRSIAIISLTLAFLACAYLGEREWASLIIGSTLALINPSGD